jgi:hypothetical protein
MQTFIRRDSPGTLIVIKHGRGGDMRAVLVVLMVFAATPAWSEWVKVDEGDKAVFYLDSAVLGEAGSRRRVWELQDLLALGGARGGRSPCGP